KNLPGFSSMRASYRWLALTAFNTWLLLLISLHKIGRRNRFMLCLPLLAIAFQLPNLSAKLEGGKSLRRQFFALEHDLVYPLSHDLKAGEKVLFLPWRNDFLANYIGALLKLTTYNIGGDKNLEEARRNWPAILRDVDYGTIDKRFSQR